MHSKQAQAAALYSCSSCISHEFLPLVNIKNISLSYLYPATNTSILLPLMTIPPKSNDNHYTRAMIPVYITLNNVLNFIPGLKQAIDMLCM